MVKKDDALPKSEQFKTPAQVAEHVRKLGVGKNYETQGQVWDSADLQNGLLHLIVDRLDKVISQLDQLVPKEDPLEAHRRWLRNWQPDVVAVCKEHKNSAIGCTAC